MRPIYLKYPAVDTNGFNTPPIPLDQYIAPGNVTVTIKMINGSAPTATVILEYTTDNVLDQTTTSIVWQPFTAAPFNSGSSSPAGQYMFTGVGAIEGMFSFAPKAVRVRCTLATGAPDMEVQVIQAGLGGT